MSKTKLFLDVVNDLRSLATSLHDLASALASEEPDIASDRPLPPAPSTVSLEQVRALLAEKSHLGFTAQVRELLMKHGAPKLSEIDPSEYPALLKDAEALS